MDRFLELFDAYTAERTVLRSLPDDEERSVRSMTLQQCASLWNDLLEERARIASYECICTACGLRHGVAAKHPGTF